MESTPLTPVTQSTSPESQSGDMYYLRQELQEISTMRRVFPFTAHLFPEGSETGKVPLPTPETMNEFAATYLQPLGATTMQVEQIDAKEFSAEEVVDCLDAYVIPIATHPRYVAHDTVDHAVGAITLHESSTQIFQQIAHISKAMRDIAPEDARVLDVALAHIFDYRTSISGRYFLRRRDQTQEPIILTHLYNYLDRFGKGIWDDETKLPSIRRIKDLVESTIDDVPPESGTDYTNESKLGRWAEWETNNLPNYSASVKEVLQQQPKLPSRFSKITRAIGKIVRPTQSA